MQPGGIRTGLGPIGLWAFQFSTVPMAEARDWAAEVEQLGFGAIWIPEAGVRDPFVTAAALLGATGRIVLATGIASIWARPATTMAAAHKSMEDAFPERFLLGMGVSHQPAVQGFYGQAYEKPYTAMVRYLDQMDGAIYMASPPATSPRRVLAALGPRMLGLSRDRTDGAHTYNVTPDHTVEARAILGPESVLAVEHAAVLTTDADEARATGRRHLSLYLGLPNYTDNLLRLGFTADDIADGGSDRLVDALVAWGTPAQIREAIEAHRTAGADHVCVQVLTTRGQELIQVWRDLAPSLLDG